MIAADSSSLIAYLGGAKGADVELVDRALADKNAVLPAPVLSELLSDPGLGAELAEILLQVPLLDITDGFWERAGRLRRSVFAKGQKARLADTLIAQICLDHDVALIARDQDYRHFVPAGLRLLP